MCSHCLYIIGLLAEGSRGLQYRKVPRFPRYSSILAGYNFKNEEGCRDDTVPKTSDTRRPCEEGV